MASNERKEVIQVNGLTILVVIALLADLFIVGLVYRYHNYQLFLVEKKNNAEYELLLGKERVIKNEIVELEGASSWDKTEYMKSLR